MIRIQGRLATYAEVWFNEPVPEEPGVDILLYKQRPKPLDDCASSTFITLINDLGADEQALMRAFGSTNRYKIKRADSKDGLEAAFLPDPRGDVKTFCDFYDQFARQKALKRVYRRGLSATVEAGELVLTFASRAGEPIVWHAYVRQGKTASLLHSASHFRSITGGDRALLGRANRWLHWRDMLALRQLGVAHYDWGGLFEDETIAEHAGVNQFKYDFGGRRVLTYNCTVPLTAKGRVLLCLQKAFARGPRQGRTVSGATAGAARP